jgi:hypothetical protein
MYVISVLLREQALPDYSCTDGSIAKPGFGKAVLSTQIIDHLRESLLRDLFGPSFHFNQRNVECQSAWAAYKAILA